VTSAAGTAELDGGKDAECQRAPLPVPSGGGRLWADLMRRTFGFDVLDCPRCGGRMRLVASIEQR